MGKEQYLTINGEEVKVDSSFFDLSKEEQDAEVQHIAAQMEANKTSGGGSAEDKNPITSSIPGAPAGVVAGAALGPAIGPAVSKAIDLPVEVMARELSKTKDAFGNATTPDSVKKWLATQSSNPFAGGRTQEEAYAKSERMAGKPVQSRGSNIPIRKGNLSEVNPPMTLPQKTAELITKSEKVGTPGIGRRMFGMGVAGGELGQMGEELSKGNYGRAALSGLGALGGVTSQSHIKPIRAVGTGIAAGVPIIQKFLLPDEEEKAEGGLVGYKGGKQVKKLLKLPMPQTASLAANLALGADSLQSSGEDLSRNIAARKYGSAANNLIDIGTTFSPYFLVPSIYSAGRSFSDTAASQLAQNPQYRQQLQSMSSSPLGGAMAGDAGLASQIMGQHQYEEPEAPGEYGSLMRNTRLPGYAPGGSVLKKLHEVLTPHEGKTLLATLADRTKATEGFQGGPGFINLHPDYTWAVDAPAVAKKHMEAVERFGGPERTLMAPMLMSREAHKSNRPVFEKIYSDVLSKVKTGELTPQQVDAINQRIMLEKKADLSKNPGIESPDFLEFANAFNRRGALADIFGLKKLGATDLQKHLDETIDPALREAPTGAIGPQLFTMTGYENAPGIHGGYNIGFKGEKGADQFIPAEREFVFRDLEKQAMEQMGRPMTD
jgi:hypothetical protein